MQNHKNFTFLTLTYSDVYLPKNGDLSYRDLQLFIKKLRKLNTAKLKYFAVGEYGEKDLRPHYHIILFGYEPKDVKKIGRYYTDLLIQKLWYQGYNTVGGVTNRSLNYTLKYCTKNLHLNYADLGLKKPKALISTNMGLNYLENTNNIERIINNECKNTFGKNIRVPRYYKKKLNITSSNKNLKRRIDLNKKVILHTGTSKLLRKNAIELTESDERARSMKSGSLERIRKQKLLNTC